MYSTSNEYKEAILDATNLQWGYSIKSNGSEIDSSEADSLLQAYQQSCYYMNSLSIGNVVSQYINMTLRGTSFSLTDSVIEPIFILGEQSVPMGKFNVLSATVENGNTIITAYDNVKKLDMPYTSVIAYPSTIAQVVNEIATLCDVTFDTTGITFPSIAIPKAYTFETCNLVMMEICKLMGCNLVADRSGTLVFKWFTQCGVTYPIDNHWKQRLDEADYVLGQLSCTTSDGKLTSGSSGGNIDFKSDYMTQSQLNAIRTAIAMTYRGADIEISGDPSIDPWDIITVTDLDNNSHPVPVMNNILVFDGAMKNTITAFAKSETESQYGTDDSGTKKIMEIQKSIDGIRVNLQENYTDNSQMQAIITATAEQISTEVAQSAVSGAIAQLGAYTVTITTPEGTTYDDNNMDKTLTVKVMNMQTDITADLPDRAFSWSRKSVNAIGDAVWNSVGRYGSTLAITSADYDDNCSFVCDVYINDEDTLKDTLGEEILDTDGLPIPTLIPKLVLRAELALQSSFKQVKSTIRQLADRITLSVNNQGKLVAVDLNGNTQTVDIDALLVRLTGALQSLNYLLNVSGSKLNLSDGSFDSKYLKWDAEGNVSIGGGGDINLISASDDISMFSMRSNTSLIEVYPPGIWCKDSNGVIYSTYQGNGAAFYDLNGTMLSSFAKSGAFFYNSSGTRIASYGPNGFYCTGDGQVRDLYVNRNLIVNQDAFISNDLWVDQDLCPLVDNKSYLGVSNFRWKQIYAVTSTISTSDSRMKENAKEFDIRYVNFFMKLLPKLYKFIDGDSGRYHSGFYSQDVEDALEECGLTSLDFAGFIKSPVYVKDEEGNDTDEIIDYIYGLRYEEFIALITKVLQDTVKRQDSFEMRLQALEERLGD